MTGGLFPGGELSDVPWWQLLILFCIAHALYDIAKTVICGYVRRVRDRNRLRLLDR